ncbi:MAG: hypothetical protein LBT56_06160 [Prevotellaceae bacterium]|jgi:hypothetical protein|nr:hypothetical protein [Prevotellaceae bacterium]
MNKIAGIIMLALAICSCSSNSNDTLLAEAYGKKLYLSNLPESFRLNDIETDSASAISTYTTAWVYNQIMMKKAEELLDEKQKNLTNEIEEYRSTLLRYKLENHISKNVDTVITQDEIEKIYNETKGLFIVQSALMKATYIKIQTAMPETENIKKMCISEKTSDMKQVEDLCMMYAEKYDAFNGKWVETYELLRLLPPGITASELEQTLQTRRFYETKDAAYSYFVKLHSILTKNSASPIEKENEKIRTIILNKRKRELIQNLEEETYNTAINNDDVKIYINNNK